MRFKANLALLLVSIIWGSSFIAQDIAAQYKTAYIFNGASFLLGGLVLRPFIKKNKRGDGQMQWMFAAGVVLFFASILQQVGIFYTKIANASFLTSLYIVFIPLLMWLAFRERPYLTDSLSVMMATIGTYLLSTLGQGMNFAFGDILEISGAIFWAIHVIILGKFGSRYEAVSFASGHFIITGVINLLVGFIVEDLNILLEIPLILAILYRGIFSVGVGYTLQVWSQNYIHPTNAALILGLESVFAAIAAWIILQQTLFSVQFVGCIIIFIAVLLPQLKSLNILAKK